MTTSRRGAIRLMSMAAVASGLPLPSLLAAASLKQEPASIHSAFDWQTGNWQLEWPGRISQYDLVYQSPPVDPLQGVALGNGEVTALIWCEASTLIVVLNKANLWEDAGFGSFGNWNKEQEDLNTTQRHAGRLIIDFKYPLFDTLYLTAFSGRLSIADGRATIEAASPFGNIQLAFFIDQPSGILSIDLTTDFKEESPLEIVLERFGSRTYSHWYAQINGDATIGTGGTSSTVHNDGLFITQQLNDRNFTAALRVKPGSSTPIKTVREHSRRSTVRVSQAGKSTLRLFVSVTSPVLEDSSAAAIALLDEAEKWNPEQVRSMNAQQWKEKWMRSFMDYGDAYLNHLWHLTMYYAMSCQGGSYPGRFNNGLWGWNRDVQNWNFYFHWNQQQLYWPLHAAGHHDLVVPYLDFRFQSLPKARKDAATFFKAPGAFIADVTERRGFNSSNESHNHTPIAEIALDFWRHYQYTGDRHFLKTQVLPFITEAALFYETLLVKEADGRYHAREGSGYEGWILLKDGLTELVYADRLFRTVLQVYRELGEPHAKMKDWQDIVQHLAPLPTIELPAEVVKHDGNTATLLTGFFKGTELPSKKIFAAGWGIKEQKMLTTYSPHPEAKYFGMKLLDGIFPSVPSSPVYPSGRLSIGQQNEEKELLDTMRTSMLLYGPGITGWDPVPVVMARLGMKEALQQTLEIFPARWQIYANGWGHWGVEGEINKDAELFFRTNTVTDTRFKDAAKFPLRMWPFRHMSMESMSVMTAAMNEALVQSCNGVIVVGAATHNGQHARCSLHAEGGFMVSAEIKGGSVLWVFIKSIWGTQCTIKNPWAKAAAWKGKKKTTMSETNGLLKLSLKKGEGLLLLPAGSDVFKWEVVAETPRQCNSPLVHKSGKAQIGIPKQF
ncbi:MAG: glycosyl hydrolase family 95 catalytic domain-containing protein [Agriterribacter sp.]